MQPSLTEKQHIDAKVHQHEPEPYLPTYEEATGQFDSSKLPSYSVKRRVRFHPYLRYFPVVVDRDATDRLFNTVFDEEYVPLNVPPARGRAGARIPPLVPDTEELARVRRNYARALAFERRVYRLQAVIGDFIQGVRRAHGQ